MIELAETIDYTNRDNAIKAIRAALKARSGKTWSVRGGTGTAWGWIRVAAAPKRCDAYGTMTNEDAAELGRLLGLEGPAHRQGVSIAASAEHRREYVARAQGQAPSAIAQPYWD